MSHAAVICNAGPLIALGKLNRLDLLVKLYGKVQIPRAVYDEVVRQGGRRGEPDAYIVRRFWQKQQWPIINITDAMLARLNLPVRLGRGEAAVLALASTIPNSLVLIDDGMARTEARRLNLEVYGTLGILVEAYRQQYVSFFASALKRILPEGKRASGR